MTYIVIHEDTENVTQYCQFEDVQAAASHLEELHNRDGISDARLFALDEVEFAVRSYVKVEIANAVPEALIAAPPPVTDAVEAGAAVEAADSPAPSQDIETIAYVEAAMLLHDGPVPITEPEAAEEHLSTSEVRRGLFGR